MMTASRTASLLLLFLFLENISAFTHVTTTNHKQSATQLNASSNNNNNNNNNLGKALVASALVMSSLVSPFAALADEYGVETEAPTLFTGETVMICKKRGPLGACLEQVPRTPENDNDKAAKYFRDPVVKRTEVADTEATNANELIQKLRQQTEDNREKNELSVKTITAMNDQSASFGPFDRSVVILNTDGKTFSVLENPQAMRLKKAGFIQDRRFVKQPTPEELEEALDSSNDGGFLGGLVKGIFGSGGDE